MARGKKSPHEPTKTKFKAIRFDDDTILMAKQAILARALKAQDETDSFSAYVRRLIHEDYERTVLTLGQNDD